MHVRAPFRIPQQLDGCGIRRADTRGTVVPTVPFVSPGASGGGA